MSLRSQNSLSYDNYGYEEDYSNHNLKNFGRKVIFTEEIELDNIGDSYLPRYENESNYNKYMVTDVILVPEPEPEDTNVIRRRHLSRSGSKSKDNRSTRSEAIAEENERFSNIEKGVSSSRFVCLF